VVYFKMSKKTFLSLYGIGEIKRMRMARNKKIALVGLSICMISLGVLSVFTYKAEKKEQMLEKVQNEALALLDERQGDYNDNIIVLNNTSHEKAESLAEKLNAKLRITNDGSFATLTLTEGRTVRDVYENDDYREELSLFDLDYPSGIAAIHSESLQENTNFRQPQKPTGGYSNQKELGSYLNLGLAKYLDNGIEMSLDAPLT